MANSVAAASSNSSCTQASTAAKAADTTQRTVTSAQCSYANRIAVLQQAVLANTQNGSTTAQLQSPQCIPKIIEASMHCTGALAEPPTHLK
jgi:hypothetical protein